MAVTFVTASDGAGFSATLPMPDLSAEFQMPQTTALWTFGNVAWPFDPLAPANKTSSRSMR